MTACPQSLALTPQNFNEFFERHSQGLEDCSSLFCPKGDLFLCQQHLPTKTFKRTWIFDADDTLWEDNIYYEEIIADLTDYILKAGVPLDRTQLREVVNEIEHEVIPKHGFGAKGFAVSMRVVYERMRDSYRPEMPEPTHTLDSIIPKLSGVPYAIPEESRKILEVLRARGEGLILFTQGPIDIQQAKIARSGLAELFDAVAVGSNKYEDTYKKLLASFSHETGEFVVVGNSLRSEIQPALALGLSAFHFRNPNTWHAGNTAEIDDSLYHAIDSLLDILQHLDL